MLLIGLLLLQQNSAVNPLQGQSTPPDGFDETEVQCYIVLNRLLSVNDDTYSFKGKYFNEALPHCEWSLSWCLQSCSTDMS